MKIQTFIGKVTAEGLGQMDGHINAWLAREGVIPSIVSQTCGTERHHDGTRDEPVLVTSIWYDESGPK